MVYIDPAWLYGGTKFKPTYRQLSMAELKELPVKWITDTNAICLMWVTGPMHK